MSFRLATAADVPALLSLVESAYRGDASRQGWTTEADLLGGQRTDPDSLREVLAAPHSRVLLLEVDAELLGCAHIQAQGDWCYFGMFSVRPTRQGGGLGDRLLRECERQAREDFGCREMRMSVIWTRTELIAWYERRGYRATGARKPFPYGDPRFGEPKRADLYFEVYAKPL